MKQNLQGKKQEHLRKGTWWLLYTQLKLQRKVNLRISLFTSQERSLSLHSKSCVNLFHLAFRQQSSTEETK